MHLFTVHMEGAILSCRMNKLPLTSNPSKCAVALVVTCVSHMHVANQFQRYFGIIKQLLPLGEGDMTICSPSTGYIALGFYPRAILPASGEQSVMSPSLKGSNCIIYEPPRGKTNNVVFEQV